MDSLFMVRKDVLERCALIRRIGFNALARQFWREPFRRHAISRFVAPFLALKMLDCIQSNGELPE